MSINKTKQLIKDIVLEQVIQLSTQVEFKKDHALILKSLTDTLKSLSDIDDDVEKDEYSEMSEEELMGEFE